MPQIYCMGCNLSIATGIRSLASLVESYEISDPMYGYLALCALTECKVTVQTGIDLVCANHKSFSSKLGGVG